MASRLLCIFPLRRIHNAKSWNPPRVYRAICLVLYCRSSFHFLIKLYKEIFFWKSQKLIFHNNNFNPFISRKTRRSAYPTVKLNSSLWIYIPVAYLKAISWVLLRAQRTQTLAAACLPCELTLKGLPAEVRLVNQPGLLLGLREPPRDTPAARTIYIKVSISLRLNCESNKNVMYICTFYKWMCIFFFFIHKFSLAISRFCLVWTCGVLLLYAHKLVRPDLSGARCVCFFSQYIFPLRATPRRVVASPLDEQECLTWANMCVIPKLY